MQNFFEFETVSFFLFLSRQSSSKNDESKKSKHDTFLACERLRPQMRVDFDLKVVITLWAAHRRIRKAPASAIPAIQAEEKRKTQIQIRSSYIGGGKGKGKMNEEGSCAMR